MTVKERILALRLLQKKEKDPAYADRIGIRAELVKKEQNTTEEKDV